MFEQFDRGMRLAALGAAAVAASVAALVLWLGHRHDAEIDRIVAEGRLAEGRFFRQDSESCSGGSSSCYQQVYVAYVVHGTTYQTSMLVRSASGSEPVFEQEVIRLPRLGEERLHQVVYLPADPSVARLRADLKKSDVAVYGTAGFFSIIAVVFGAAGFFLFRRRQRHDG